jgi:hypothetical protein
MRSSSATNDARVSTARKVMTLLHFKEKTTTKNPPQTGTRYKLPRGTTLIVAHIAQPLVGANTPCPALGGLPVGLRIARSYLGLLLRRDTGHVRWRASHQLRTRWTTNRRADVSSSTHTYCTTTPYHFVVLTMANLHACGILLVCVLSTHARVVLCVSN